MVLNNIIYTVECIDHNDKCCYKFLSQMVNNEIITQLYNGKISKLLSHK